VGVAEDVVAAVFWDVDGRDFAEAVAIVGREVMFPDIYQAMWVHVGIQKKRKRGFDQKTPWVGCSIFIEYAQP
jgi:hypothetical protein